MEVNASREEFIGPPNNLQLRLFGEASEPSEACRGPLTPFHGGNQIRGTPRHGG
jgi:hypothetical protein